MKKIYIMVISVITIVFILLNIYNTTCIAGDFADIIEKGNEFIEKGKNEVTINYVGLRDTSNVIFNILLLLGTFMTAIVGAIIGIKYMLASAEDKAKVKESMIPYILGCIVIFGATGIWKICMKIFSIL